MYFLNLAVARLAVKHGLFAPVNAVVARLVEHCERRGPVRPASPRSPQAAAPTDPAADE